MPNQSTIPLSLYIHMPWCVKKCPYCDFNSHELKTTIPEEQYINQLITDLTNELDYVQGRFLKSIFLGGGTPSLFSAKAYQDLLARIATLIPFETDIEITLEANPGTFEQERFQAYRQIGINRLSIGCQSFQQHHLQKLGRIHDAQQATIAITKAKDAGFENFNIDLMFALPNQTTEEALNDLETAIELQPKHLSWYQLTLEPNTVFHKYPPKLPDDERVHDMIIKGKALLSAAGFNQYEVSAYAKPKYNCKHNLNYWRFGDYLGIGAGAHGKISFQNNNSIKVLRTNKFKLPKKYLSTANPCHEINEISKTDLAFEFMLNKLRLYESVEFEYFQNCTGLDAKILEPTLQKLSQRELIELHNDGFKTTMLGKRFLNDVIECFLTI